MKPTKAEYVTIKIGGSESSPTFAIVGHSLISPSKYMGPSQSGTTTKTDISKPTTHAGLGTLLSLSPKVLIVSSQLRSRASRRQLPRRMTAEIQVSNRRPGRRPNHRPAHAPQRVPTFLNYSRQAMLLWPRSSRRQPAEPESQYLESGFLDSPAWTQPQRAPAPGALPAAAASADFGAPDPAQRNPR